MRLLVCFLFLIFSNGLIFAQAIEVSPAGNVGIGTSTPQNYGGYTTVDISGTSSAQGARLQVKTFNESVKGLLSAESDKVVLNVPTNHPLIFKVNDSDKARVNTNGSFTVGSSGEGVGIIEGAKADNATMALFDTRSVAASVGGGIFFGGVYSGASKTTWASLFGLKENATSGDYGGCLSFQTRPNGGSHSERVRITSTGNVGIGTTNPTQKLQIGDASTTVSNSVFHYGLASGANQGASYNFFNGSKNVMSIGNVSNIIGGSYTDDAGIYWDATNSLRFYNGANERMRISSVGNVGVGGTPTDYGSGYKTLLVKGSSNSFGGVLDLKSLNESVHAQFYADSNVVSLGSISTHPLIFNSASAERMRIASNGLVGIGTASPVAKLDLRGDAGVATCLLNLQHSTSGAGSSSFVFFSGNLGGAVNGDALWANNTGNLFISPNASGKKLYLNGGIWTSAGMTIDGSNNVGIGTSTPAEKLEVNGTVKATSFKVGSTTLNVPDYVFEANYALKSLEEVEASIQEKGHLPGVPSAKEINANGLDMVQMQLKLLEKVEELTLYSISQNKKLKEKEIQMAALLERIEKLENQSK